MAGTFCAKMASGMSSYLESQASFVPQLILRRANRAPKGITVAAVERVGSSKRLSIRRATRSAVPLVAANTFVTAPIDGAMAFGDIDADGKLDAMVGSGGDRASVSVLLNQTR